MELEIEMYARPCAASARIIRLLKDKLCLNPLDGGFNARSVTVKRSMFTAQIVGDETRVSMKCEIGGAYECLEVASAVYAALEEAVKDGGLMRDGTNGTGVAGMDAFFQGKRVFSRELEISPAGAKTTHVPQAVLMLLSGFCSVLGGLALADGRLVAGSLLIAFGALDFVLALDIIKPR